MNFAEGTVLTSFTVRVCNLGSSAFVLFGFISMHLFSKYGLQAQIFKISASYQPLLN